MDNNITRTAKRKKSRTKKRILLGVLFVFLIGIAWAGANYYSFNKAMVRMNGSEEIEGAANMATSDQALHLEPFSVLLLGIDERKNDNGRTDTMIVATVNPDLGTIKMLSIPRDARVDIIGNDTVEKINHAYTRGGTSMTINTVEHLLSIPINYYVAVNMEGFLSIIDVVNGIKIKNDLDLAHGKYTFPKGEMTINGEEALVFSRIRYGDPRGDFGRQVRQKQLLEALLAEAKNPKILLQLNDIFKVLGDNVKMNFTASQLMDLQKLYGKLDGKIDQLQFENGVGQTIGKYWYYILDEQEVNQVSEELNQHLELKS
ncbi:LCP family protein [Lysinibacillus sp. NPDC096418]|uniref:LCP family glycopolymer transferase n=1 Tax=Lysinibacillus sp. NPDC096418 TaxID=3364138 RepID=UPI00380F3D92